MVLNCRHNDACMFRFIHKGVTEKYCMACLMEKNQDCNINGDIYKSKHIPGYNAKKDDASITKPKKVIKEKVMNDAVI